jgi:hypothetical protein
MSNVELTGRICLSFAAGMVLLSGIARYHPKFVVFHRWMLLASALVGIIGLTVTFLLPGNSFYGRIDGSMASSGIGVVCMHLLWPNPSRRSMIVANILAVVLISGCWIPTPLPWPYSQGGWFWVAQIVASIGVSFWLYAACLLLESTQGTNKLLLYWAFLLQVVGLVSLTIGAHRVWGWVLGWDPVITWWLFAVFVNAFALWGWRKFNWDKLAVVIIGLVPTAFVWFGSWFIIRALNLVTLYASG